MHWRGNYKFNIPLCH